MNAEQQLVLYSDLLERVRSGRMTPQEADEEYTKTTGNKTSLVIPTIPEAEAIQILSNPDLFWDITKKELAKAIVGEEKAKHVLFLCMQGRLVENYEPSSFNILINSESGAGKDWVARHLVKILPESCYEYRTRISSKAFTYWHNSKFEPDWSWDGKVCYLEDIANDVLNDDTFKVMASSGSHATIVKDNRAIDVKINGKPVILVTSATASPKHELLRRFVTLQLDETVDQTKAVMMRKAKNAADGSSENSDYDEKIVQAMMYLKRVKVKVPFAELFIEAFPSDHIIMRTYFSRFIDWMKASCAFHQYQRSQDADGYYLATEQDYEIARQAIQYITTNKYMIPLTQDELKLFDTLTRLSPKFDIDDASAAVSFMSERTVRRKLEKFANFGFLSKGSEIDERGRRVITYNRPEKPLGEVILPSWSELMTIRQTDKDVNHDNLTASTDNPDINTLPQQRDTIPANEAF